MQVQHVMTPDPVTVSIDESVEEAWERMSTIQTHHLMVVEDGRLVGIVSDRDLRDREGLQVGEVMTSDPLTVTPDVGLIEAGKLLLSHQINAAPVIDGTGRLLGVLTTTNCLVAMIQLHHELDLATR